MEYALVQRIAKDTIKYIKNTIKPGMNLMEVRELCERKLYDLGADSFWYWDIGAFVFAGEETIESVSGREYETSNRMIKENDIVTIDLSPQIGDIWGDFARTIVMENGAVVEKEAVSNQEWKKGLWMEDELHRELIRFATPNTTFEELYYHMNAMIVAKGFVNLDFAGNLGHSIAKKKNDRLYIEKGNKRSLSEVAYFTFEPHISNGISKYGYKKENIYYFESGSLKEL